MTTTDKTLPAEKVLTTIRHLLARQHHPRANENEAAICAEKVAALLLKHGLSMSQVEAGGTDGKQPGVTEQRIGMGVGPRDSYGWSLTLASAVCSACFCRFLVEPVTRTLLILGHQDDAEVAGALFEFLARQVSRLALEATYDLPLVGEHEEGKEVRLHGLQFTVKVPPGWTATKRRKQPGVDSYSFTRNFLYGCSQRVALRLYDQVRAARAQHERGAEVTALVSLKDRAVERYIEERWQGRLSKLAPGKGADGAGLIEGFQAGDRVQLHNRTQVTGGEEASATG